MNTGAPLTKVLVIICEEVLEPLLSRDIVACGAKGYSVATVRGRGHRGVSDAQWPLSNNVRFEILCTPEEAQSIAEQVRGKYERNFGLVLFCMDASTLDGI